MIRLPVRAWLTAMLMASSLAGCFPPALLGPCDTDADCGDNIGPGFEGRCQVNGFCEAVPLPGRLPDGGLPAPDGLVVPPGAIVLGANVDGGGCFLVESEAPDDDLRADGGPLMFAWSCPDLPAPNLAPDSGPELPNEAQGRDAGDLPSPDPIGDPWELEDGGRLDAGPLDDGRGDDAGPAPEPGEENPNPDGRTCEVPDGGLLVDGGPGVGMIPIYDGGFQCPEPE